MKTLLPFERTNSVGRLQKLAAVAVAASISCLPLSALADDTSGDGHVSGGVGHPGGGAHPNGGSRGGAPHPAASYHPSAPSYRASSRTSDSSFGRSATNTYRANPYERNSDSSQVNAHHESTATTHRELSTIEHQDATVNRMTNTSHPLSQTNRTDGAKNASRITDPAHAAMAEALRAKTQFNHSLTASSAQTRMNQRLDQISNRQWTGHGAFFSDHFDRDHGCWFNHDGFWWRCNFWGANWYCNHLITLGFAPGLCWAWYDDICWGNLVDGMPLDLIDYYYPDPVYSDYTTYDGDEATVYYYPTDDGQYMQVTVVDGTVVDVEIVDQIS